MKKFLTFFSLILISIMGMVVFGCEDKYANLSLYLQTSIEANTDGEVVLYVGDETNGRVDVSALVRGADKDFNYSSSFSSTLDNVTIESGYEMLDKGIKRTIVAKNPGTDIIKVTTAEGGKEVFLKVRIIKRATSFSFKYENNSAVKGTTIALDDLVVLDSNSNENEVTKFSYDIYYKSTYNGQQVVTDLTQNGFSIDNSGNLFVPANPRIGTAPIKSFWVKYSFGNCDDIESEFEILDEIKSEAIYAGGSFTYDLATAAASGTAVTKTQTFVSNDSSLNSKTYVIYAKSTSTLQLNFNNYNYGDNKYFNISSNKEEIYQSTQGGVKTNLLGTKWTVVVSAISPTSTRYIEENYDIKFNINYATYSIYSGKDVSIKATSSEYTSEIDVRGPQENVLKVYSYDRMGLSKITFYSRNFQMIRPENSNFIINVFDSNGTQVTDSSKIKLEDSLGQEIPLNQDIEFENATTITVKSVDETNIQGYKIVIIPIVYKDSETPKVFKTITLFYVEAVKEIGSLTLSEDADTKAVKNTLDTEMEFVPEITVGINIDTYRNNIEAEAYTNGIIAEIKANSEDADLSTITMNVTSGNECLKIEKVADGKFKLLPQQIGKNITVVIGSTNLGASKEKTIKVNIYRPISEIDVELSGSSIGKKTEQEGIETYYIKRNYIDNTVSNIALPLALSINPLNADVFSKGYEVTPPTGGSAGDINVTTAIGTAFAETTAKTMNFVLTISKNAKVIDQENKGYYTITFTVKDYDGHEVEKVIRIYVYDAVQKITFSPAITRLYESTQLGYFDLDKKSTMVTVETSPKTNNLENISSEAFDVSYGSRVFEQEKVENVITFYKGVAGVIGEELFTFNTETGTFTYVDTSSYFSNNDIVTFSYKIEDLAGNQTIRSFNFTLSTPVKVNQIILNNVQNDLVYFKGLSAQPLKLDYSLVSEREPLNSNIMFLIKNGEKYSPVSASHYFEISGNNEDGFTISPKAAVSGNTSLFIVSQDNILTCEGLGTAESPYLYTIGTGAVKEIDIIVADGQSAASAFLILSAQDLIDIDDFTAYYRLAQNITLYDYVPSTTAFSGNFNGRYKSNSRNIDYTITIAGMVDNYADPAFGLFQSNSGTIENLTINYNNFILKTTRSVNFGGVAGENNGTIENCKVLGTVNITANNGGNIGGVAGINNGAISGSYKAIADEGTAPITFGNSAFDVSLNLYVSAVSQVTTSSIGGVAGLNLNTIQDINTQGQVSAAKFDNVGGLVGQCGKGGEGETADRIWELSHSYSTISVIGFDNVGGAVGISFGGTINEVSAENYKQSGKSRRVFIEGNNNVAGLIGSSDNTLLENSYVVSYFGVTAASSQDILAKKEASPNINVLLNGTLDDNSQNNAYKGIKITAGGADQNSNDTSIPTISSIEVGVKSGIDKIFKVSNNEGLLFLKKSPTGIPAYDKENEYKITDILDITIITHTTKTAKLIAKSSDDKVLRVNGDGTISLLSEGKVTLTIYSALTSDVYDSVTLYVQLGIDDDGFNVYKGNNISENNKITNDNYIELLKNSSENITADFKYSINDVQLQTSQNLFLSLMTEDSYIEECIKVETANFGQQIINKTITATNATQITIGETTYTIGQTEGTTPKLTLTNGETTTTATDATHITIGEKAYTIGHTTETTPRLTLTNETTYYVVNTDKKTAAITSLNKTEEKTLLAVPYYKVGATRIYLMSLARSVKINISEGAKDISFDYNKIGAEIKQRSTFQVVVTIETDKENDDILSQEMGITDNNLAKLQIETLATSRVVKFAEDSETVKSISRTFLISYKDSLGKTLESDITRMVSFCAASNVNIKKTISITIIPQDVDAVEGQFFAQHKMGDEGNAEEKTDLIFNGEENRGLLELFVYPDCANYSYFDIKTDNIGVSLIPVEYNTVSRKYQTLSNDITKPLYEQYYNDVAGSPNEKIVYKKSATFDNGLDYITHTYSYRYKYLFTISVNDDLADGTPINIDVVFYSSSGEVVRTLKNNEKITLYAVATPKLTLSMSQDLQYDDKYVLPIGTKTEIDVNAQTFEGSLTWSVDCEGLTLAQKNELIPFQDVDGKYYISVPTTKTTPAEGEPEFIFLNKNIKINAIAQKTVNGTLKTFSKSISILVKEFTPTGFKVSGINEGVLEGKQYDKTYLKIELETYRADDSMINSSVNEAITALENEINKSDMWSILVPNNDKIIAVNLTQMADEQKEIVENYVQGVFVAGKENEYSYVEGKDIDQYKELRVTFSIGLNETDFSQTNAVDASGRFSQDFSLVFRTKTTLRNALPIYNAEEFMAMSAGNDYILMNDIILDNYTPLSTAISSFDGNNKTIYIKGFSYTADSAEETEEDVALGLFNTVSEDTQLQNINVYYTEDAIYTYGDFKETTEIDKATVVYTLNNGEVTTSATDTKISTKFSLSSTTLSYLNGMGVSTVKTFGSEGITQITINRSTTTTTKTTTTGATQIVQDYYSVICSNGDVDWIADISQSEVPNNGETDNREIISASKVNDNSLIVDFAPIIVGTSSDETGSISFAPFGGIAVTNNGIITNCTVSGNIKVVVKQEETNLTQNGGLVVTNNGFITNSKVKGLILSACGSIGGFVNVNNNKISSCYFDDSQINNISTTTVSGYGTAGFVYNNAENGFISGCYSQGSKLKNDYSLTNSGKGIRANGNAAGFAYRNSATIDNCYANVKIITSSYAAGFVFYNDKDVSNCYSMSLVKEAAKGASPFSGLTTSGGLVIYENQNATVNDCYYLEGGYVSYVGEKAQKISVKDFSTVSSFPTFNLNTENDSTDNFDYVWVMKDGAPRLSTTLIETISEKKLIKVSKSYSGVEIASTLVDTGSDISTNQKVYQTEAGKQLILTFNGDKIVSAIFDGATVDIEDIIKRQNVGESDAGYFVQIVESALYSYTILDDSPQEGTIENPYLIYDVDSYNVYIRENNTTIDTKTIYGQTKDGTQYYRVVCDIDFYDKNITTVDKIFSGKIDGNNMEFQRVAIVYDNSNYSTAAYDVRAFGFMAELRGGTVKNLYLDIIEVLSSVHYCVGGFVGLVTNNSTNNGVLNNIHVNYNEDNGGVVLGRNLVGGVVGYALNGVRLYNIYSSISVNSTYLLANTSASVTETYAKAVVIANISLVSYAGGAIGAIDGTEITDSQEKHIQNIYVFGEMSVSGRIAGGVIGLIAKDSKIQNINLEISNNQFIQTSNYGGGLIGENRGEVNIAEISYPKATQAIIDALGAGAYYENGNRTFFQSPLSNNQRITSIAVGGIIGLNVGGTLSNAISKIDVRNIYSKIAGGAVGRMVGGTLTNVMTTASVKANMIIGGMVGVITQYNTYKNNSISNGDANTFETNNFNGINLTTATITTSTNSTSITSSNEENDFENCAALNNWPAIDYITLKEETDVARARGAFIGLITDLLKAGRSPSIKGSGNSANISVYASANATSTSATYLYMPVANYYESFDRVKSEAYKSIIMDPSTLVKNTDGTTFMETYNYVEIMTGNQTQESNTTYSIDVKHSTEGENSSQAVEISTTGAKVIVDENGGLNNGLAGAFYKGKFYPEGSFITNATGTTIEFNAFTINNDNKFTFVTQDDETLHPTESDGIFNGETTVTGKKEVEFTYTAATGEGCATLSYVPTNGTTTTITANSDGLFTYENGVFRISGNKAKFIPNNTFENAVTRGHYAEPQWTITTSRYPTLNKTVQIQNWYAFAQEVTPTDNVYEVSTPEQLAWVAKAVAEENNTFAGKIIELAADIDLSGRYWTPIGSYEKQFKGSFNGNGHSINYAVVSSISNPIGGDGTDYGYAGIFGYVSDATIQGITTMGGNITGTTYAGGIIGCAEGVIIGNLTNGNTVYGSQYVGGVVGYISNGSDSIGYLGSEAKPITNNGSVNYAESTQTNVCIGGVFGWVQGISKNLTNTADISITAEHTQNICVGGITGRTQSSVDNAINNGNVSYTSPSVGAEKPEAYVGGIIGKVEYSSTDITISNASNNGKLSFVSNYNKNKNGLVTENAVFGLGGIVGFAKKASVIKSNNTAKVRFTSNKVNSSIMGIGGIVGIADSAKGSGYSIDQCYNIGEIETYNTCGGETFATMLVGGILGCAMDDNTEETAGVIAISNCYNAENVSMTGTSSHQTFGGGLIGTVVLRSTTNGNTYYSIDKKINSNSSIIPLINISELTLGSSIKYISIQKSFNYGLIVISNDSLPQKGEDANSKLIWQNGAGSIVGYDTNISYSNVFYIADTADSYYEAGVGKKPVPDSDITVGINNNHFVYDSCIFTITRNSGNSTLIDSITSKATTSAAKTGSNSYFYNGKTITIGENGTSVTISGLVLTDGTNTILQTDATHITIDGTAYTIGQTGGETPLLTLTDGTTVITATSTTQITIGGTTYTYNNGTTTGKEIANQLFEYDGKWFTYNRSSGDLKYETEAAPASYTKDDGSFTYITGTTIKDVISDNRVSISGGGVSGRIGYVSYNSGSNEYSICQITSTDMKTSAVKDILGNTVWEQIQTTWYPTLINNKSQLFWNDFAVSFEVEDAIVIKTPEQLAYLSKVVNNGTLNTNGLVFRLGDNIDLSNRYFTPIGTSENPFRGTFDGNNYVIKNITILENKEYEYSGLFGCVENQQSSTGLFIANAKIKNVRLENCIITQTSADNFVGAIAGKIKNTDIELCYVDGLDNIEITLSGSTVGGLVGIVQGTSSINKCYNKAIVSGTIAGAFVGKVDGNLTVSNCFNTGDITQSSAGATNCERALFGCFVSTNNDNSTNRLNVSYVYSIGKYNEGTSDICLKNGINASYTTGADMSDSDTYSSNNGWDFVETWSLEQYSTNKIGSIAYPSIRGLGQNWVDVEAAEINQNSDGQYVIAGEEDLAWLMKNTNDGSFDTKSKVFVLTENLDLSSKYWTPIGTTLNPFRGIFYFDNNEISGITIDSSLIQYAGLFGCTNGAIINGGSTLATLTTDQMGTDGVVADDIEYVKNDGFEDTINISGFVKIDNTTTMGSVYAGGLVAYGVNTEIGNIRSCVDVFAACKNNNAFAGGIAGGMMSSRNSCSITNCFVCLSSTYNNGKISIPKAHTETTQRVSKEHEFGVVAIAEKGNAMSGGIVGIILGTYTTADESILENCSSSVGVLGLTFGNGNFSSFVGGVAGYASEHIHIKGVLANRVEDSGEDAIIKGYSIRRTIVGGVVGYLASGTIELSGNEQKLEGTAVGDAQYIGGIVGWLKVSKIGNLVNVGELSGDLQQVSANTVRGSIIAYVEPETVADEIPLQLVSEGQISYYTAGTDLGGAVGWSRKIYEGGTGEVEMFSTEFPSGDILKSSTTTPIGNDVWLNSNFKNVIKIRAGEFMILA